MVVAPNGCAVLLYLDDPTGQKEIAAYIPPTVAGEMSKFPQVYIQMTSPTPKTRVFIDAYTSIVP